MSIKLIDIGNDNILLFILIILIVEINIKTIYL